jgi:hypothetical protein
MRPAEKVEHVASAISLALRSAGITAGRPVGANVLPTVNKEANSSRVSMFDLDAIIGSSINAQRPLSAKSGSGTALALIEARGDKFVPSGLRTPRIGLRINIC